MYIESLDITDFGFFSGKNVDLKDGLNVLEGKNESGKSTVADFIRFILYGFSGKADRERHVKLTKNSASGSLILREGDKRYRVERHASGAKESFGIYDLSDGSQYRKGEVPGEVFFGLPADLFEGTVFVGQTGGSHIDGRTTAESVDNMLFAADENQNVKKTLKRLDDARVDLLYKNEKGGRIYELGEKLSDMKVKLSEASEQNAEIISLKGNIESIERKLISAEAERKKLEDQMMQYRKREARQRIERVAALEHTWNRIERELSEFRLSHTRNGYFPDVTYYENVRECAAEFSSADGRVKEIESELNQLSEEMRQAEAEREEINRRERLSCDKLNRKRNMVLTAAILFCVIFIISAGLAVYLFATSKSGGGLAVSLISLASLVCMVVGFLLISRYNTAIRKIESGMDSKDDIRQYRLDQIRCDLERAKNERSKLRTMLTDLCGKWGYDQPARLLSDLKPVLEEEKKRERECEESRFEYTNYKVMVEKNTDEIEDDGAPITLPEKFDPKEADKRLKFVTSSIPSYVKIKHDKELRLATLAATAVLPSSVEEQIISGEYELEKLKSNYAAYILAEKVLQTASDNLRASVSPKLSEEAGKYMSAITNGKYDELGVDGELSMTFRPGTSEGGKVTAGDIYMSAGTSDAAYVSLRLSIASMLCGGKVPPMVFDESFSRLDDERLCGMLKMLNNGKMQAIVLTSSDREYKMLKKTGENANRVILN